MDTAADDTVTDGPDGTGERPAGGEGAARPGGAGSPPSRPGPGPTSPRWRSTASRNSSASGSSPPPHPRRGLPGKNPRFGGGAHWWDVLATWDGWWYLQVAEHGYSPALVRLDSDGLFTVQQNSVAFFPLYPALIRMVSESTGLGLYGSGILVSVVSSFVAAAGSTP